MGAEYSTKSSPDIKVKVIGTTRIEKVDLVKNGKNLHRFSGNNEMLEFEYKDKTIEKGNNYYYLRVKQADLEMAWSSPIFVEFR